MTILKAARFHIRRPALPLAQQRPSESKAPHRPIASAEADRDDMPFAHHEDGFGDEGFETAGRAPEAVASPSPDPAAAPPFSRARNAAEIIQDAIDAIRKEGLTGRQLRTARSIAQSHRLNATSDYDAVRLLREAGVDPFRRSSMLDLVAPEATSSEGNRALVRVDEGEKLPQTAPTRSPNPPEVNHAAEILRMQRDIAKRRRRKLGLLFTRLFLFIILPTLVALWYFSALATRLYTTHSEFVIQQAENPTAMGGMGGLLQGTAMATSQDSIAVQGYLQSRDAMLRLEKDHGFREHFQGESIDPLMRLDADATLEEGYRLYQRYVLISYDPSEGLIRMDVSAPNPELSAIWSRQLIEYAEEQIDQLTQRLREDAMRGARESYEEATSAVMEAQRHLIALQERYKVVSSESELALLTQQIGTLDGQLMQERLSLAQMESNSNPNQARMEPVKRRILTLEQQIADLRRRLTEGEAGGESLARVQGELLVAQADLQTRQLILSTSLQAMENARIEANRQVRYLSLAVSPVPPDSPSTPRIFENTMVSMLILLGIYLMVSMTVAILREQVSA